MNEDPDGFDEMLTYSGGKAQVPVIVDGDKVTIGFMGDVSLRGGIPIWRGLTSQESLSVRGQEAVLIKQIVDEIGNRTKIVCQ